jgi:hypothetical protein
MAVSRRTTYLGLALVVTLVVALALWSSGGSGGAAATSMPRRAAATSQTPSAQPASETGPGHVNLEALRAGRGQPIDTGRNPFRFESRSPTPDDGGGELPSPKPLNQGPAVFAPPGPTGPPPPPPIPLKFIGILTQGSKRVAVLTDGKSSPVGGVEGEIILGQYQILKIGNESIEMAYPDGRGRQTIRLTGQ